MLSSLPIWDLRVHLETGHYLCRGGWGEGEKKGGGGKAISDWLEGGGGLNFFIKNFRGDQQFEVYSIVRGVHWPRWVKQLNSRVQTLSVKQYC